MSVWCHVHCGVSMINRALLMATVMSVMLLCAALWQALDQPVNAFVVKGELTSLERDHIQQVLQDTVGDSVEGLLSTALEEVIAAVQALPWARDVSVRRQWPDKLVVTLYRARPVARWGEREYLSVQGELFELPDEYVGLPHFDIRLSTPQQAMQVYRLLDQIAAHEDLAIRSLNQDELGEWRVDMNANDGALQVMLGNEQLSDRMRRFVSVYRHTLSGANRAVEYVDARYVNGLAVRYADAPVDALLAGVPSAALPLGELQ